MAKDTIYIRNENESHWRSKQNDKSGWVNRKLAEEQGKLPIITSEEEELARALNRPV